VPRILLIDSDAPVVDALPPDVFQAFGMGSAGEPQVSQRLGSLAVVPIKGRLSKTPSIMRLFGYSTAPTTGEIEEEILNLASMSAVQTIVLHVDSPGGEADGTQGLADAIAEAGRSKRVIASIDGKAGSAAYWLASQASEVYAGKGSVAGHIGAFAVLTDTTEADRAVGLKRFLVADGEFKGLGADGEVTPELLADVKRMVLACSQQFVSAVASGRGIPETKAASWKTGQYWMAEEAASMGLIDGVKSYRQILAGLAKGEHTVKNQNQQLAAEGGDTPVSADVSALRAQVESLSASVATLVQTIDTERKERVEERAEESKTARSKAVGIALDALVRGNVISGADREAFSGVLSTAGDEEVSTFLQALAARQPGVLAAPALPPSENVELANTPRPVPVPRILQHPAGKTRFDPAGANAHAIGEAAKAKAIEAGKTEEEAHAAYRAAIYASVAS